MMVRGEVARTPGKVPNEGVRVKPSPHYSRALLLQSRIRCCDEPSAGRLAEGSLDVLFKYASGPHGSACLSHNATARFRDEPS